MEDGKKTPVLINLLAIAKYDQMPDYPIQFMTKGMLHYRDNGDAEIAYTETQQDEDSGEIVQSDIILNCSNQRVTMERKGDFSNTMVFANGVRFEGKYQTPYGDMGLAVFARKVECNIGEKKGAIHLKYQLDIQGNYTSTNELHLEYHAE